MFGFKALVFKGKALDCRGIPMWIVIYMVLANFFTAPTVRYGFHLWISLHFSAMYVSALMQAASSNPVKVMALLRSSSFLAWV